MRRRPYQPNAPGQPLTAGPAPEEDLLQRRIVTLTPTQIKNLHATPILLIPAPGADKVTVLIATFAKLIFNTTRYTNAGASSIEFNIGPVIDENGYVILPANFVTNDRTSERVDQALSLTMIDEPFENSPIMAYNPDAGEFATGDSDLVITLFYAFTAP